MLEATIQGNLGKDPTFKQFQQDRAVCNFSVGCYTGKDKDTQEAKTTWVRVAVWGAMAEKLAGILKTGSGVLCRGRLELQKWYDNDGVERQALNMTASTCMPVRVDWGGQQQASAPPQQQRPTSRATMPPPQDVDLSEAPF